MVNRLNSCDFLFFVFCVTCFIFFGNWFLYFKNNEKWFCERLSYMKTWGFKGKKNRRETIKIGILLVSIIYLFSGKGQTQSLWKITVLTLRIFIYETEMEYVWTYRDWNIVYPLLNTCTIILPSSLWFRSLQLRGICFWICTILSNQESRDLRESSASDVIIAVDKSVRE
jgi:hypothetical protein